VHALNSVARAGFSLVNLSKMVIGQNNSIYSLAVYLFHQAPQSHAEEAPGFAVVEEVRELDAGKIQRIHIEGRKQ
jgi:hypothetical protein